jgi:hypothetical protein
MVCYSFKFFKSVNVRICHLQNLFADCPPLLHRHSVRGCSSVGYCQLQLPHLKSKEGDHRYSGELDQNSNSPMLSVSGHNHLPCVTRLTRNTVSRISVGKMIELEKVKFSLVIWKDLIIRFFTQSICRNYNVSFVTAVFYMINGC